MQLYIVFNLGDVIVWREYIPYITFPDWTTAMQKYIIFFKEKKKTPPLRRHETKNTKKKQELQAGLLQKTTCSLRPSHIYL